MTRYGAVFAGLRSAEVPFVVVGGTAVVLQGHPRLTVALDLVVDLQEAPLRRAIGVLLGLGLRARLPVDPYDFADPVIREGWRRERSLTVFSFHDPADPFREVDLFAAAPLPFEELLAGATRVSVDGVLLHVASIEHLVLMKQAAARPRDLEDVVALQRLRGTP